MTGIGSRRAHNLLNGGRAADDGRQKGTNEIYKRMYVNTQSRESKTI